MVDVSKMVEDFNKLYECYCKPYKPILTKVYLEDQGNREQLAKLCEDAVVYYPGPIPGLKRVIGGQSFHIMVDANGKLDQETAYKKLYYDDLYNILKKKSRLILKGEIYCTLKIVVIMDIELIL